MGTHSNPRLDNALGLYVQITYKSGKKFKGVLYKEPGREYYLENEKGRYLFYKSNIRELKILK